MEISTTTQAASKPAASTTVTSQKDISSDFETFLQMLSAQMKNQDPLNPIESTDYAVQLATFSSVEQQVKTNTLLEGLAASLTGSALESYSGWVGRDVRHAGATRYASGTQVDLFPKAAAPSVDKRELIVQTAEGTVVGRRDITSATSPIAWPNASTETFPAGTYRFSVESSRDGEVVSTEAVELYAPVEEIRLGKSGPTLVTQGGIEVPANAVTAIRQAG